MGNQIVSDTNCSESARGKICGHADETSSSPPPSVQNYDRYIVAFSGGKDSTAAFLHLLELGVDPNKIELWHQSIDGDSKSFMDWPCTKSYIHAFAKAFRVPIYFSWRDGGFERELTRENQLTGNTHFEAPDGTVKVRESKDLVKFYNTRKKFPAISNDLSVRWCSSYLKIMVATSAIRNQERFRNLKTLVITGERAQESAARAKYEVFEPHDADARYGKLARHVDHWRPILSWREEDVWSIIERFKIHAHPVYYLGFSRASCALCIFSNPSQYASSRFLVPEAFEKLSGYEDLFGFTLRKGTTLKNFADSGQIYPGMNEHYVSLVRSTSYSEPIFLSNWSLPRGAFGKSCGPG